MKTSDFFYNLPEELIAQTPLEPRDSSRMMVLHRDSDEIEHKHFYDIVDYLNEGDCLQDFVGPLGRATETEGLKKVAVVGGGVGCAIAYPVAKKLHELGVEVHSIVGFRSKDLVILEDEFRASSSKFVLMSDDGTAGEKGLVTDALKKLIDSGEKYDRVITIGPLAIASSKSMR